MIFILMMVLCGLWGLWCARNDVQFTPMIIVSGLIGLIAHFIESGVGV